METRGNFGSKLGVILATAGSAVGLGNVWRFPLYGRSEWWCRLHSHLFGMYHPTRIAWHDERIHHRPSFRF